LSTWNGDDGKPFESFYTTLRAYTAKKDCTYLFTLTNYDKDPAIKEKQVKSSNNMMFVMLNALTQDSLPRTLVEKFLEPINEGEDDLVPSDVPRFYMAWQEVLKYYKPKRKGESSLADHKLLLEQWDTFSITKKDDVRTRIIKVEALTKQLSDVGICKSIKEQLLKVMSLLEPLNLYSVAIRDVFKADLQGKLNTDQLQVDTWPAFTSDVYATYKIRGRKQEKSILSENDNDKKDTGSINKKINADKRSADSSANASMSHNELLVLASKFEKQLKSINGCNHCREKGYKRWARHVEERCWELHPELKPAADGTVTPDPDRLGLDGVPNIST
jgi:hypothetical protein